MAKSVGQKTILVVEDEEALLLILEKTLNQAGFKTITSKDGYEGLNMALKHHPHLVLVDIIMPRMDGITMLKELRKDSYGKDVPVIILTNLSNPESMSAALENHAFDYLVKTDWDPETLVQKIKDKLKV